MDHNILNKNYQRAVPNLLAETCQMASIMNNVIDLSVGDPDFTTPIAITKHAFNAACAGMTHYTSSLGLSSLRQAVADYYQKKWRLSVNKNQVMITVGAEHALFIALQAITNPGDEIIVLEPCFSPYFDQVKLTGGKLIKVWLNPNHDFKIDFAAISAALTSKTKAIVINFPNNPTGSVITDQEMEQLAALVKKNNLLVFSDEIYADYVMPNQNFVPFSHYAPENTVTVSGFSKSYAMTGWRIGYLIGPAWLITAANEVNDAVTFSAPTISQVAAEYALNHHDELVPPIIADFQKRLHYLEKELNQIAWLHVSPISGSIYAFVNIQATKLDSVTFAKKLLQQTKILVVPGLAFGSAGEGFIRIAATQPLVILKEAVKRLKQLDWTD